MRLRLHRIELDQQLSLGDALAIADQQLFYHPTDQRLHSLAFARHHHGAAAHDTLVEWRQTGPEQETAQCQDQETHTIACRAPGVGAGAWLHCGAARTQPMLAVRLCLWGQITHLRQPP
ncbi:hypothetical protein D3C84_775790 [compost metagenome]